MKTIKFSVVIISLLLCRNLMAQQMGFVNNGMKITVEQGAHVYVNDFTNTQAGADNGTVDLDGDLMVMGNINNTSSGNVFVNIEAAPDGSLTLGGNNQVIQGTTPIFFENLKIKNSTKTLELNNCEVKGIMSLDGALDLNKNRLIIDNSSTAAISYLSGFIKSETTPTAGLGEIEWRTGNTVGAFSVPFGAGFGSNDLNLIVNTLTAPDPSTGSIVFATYPTDGSNKPYPGTIVSLDTMDAKNIADRYWKLEPNFSTKPDVSIIFRYMGDDVDQTDNPGMLETNLKAIRYNDALGKWTDMNMTGTSDITSKTVQVDNISASNYFAYWTLSELELKIPNAFTPFDEEPNNYFLKGYKVTIVNRWGQKIFDGDNGWDGTTDNGKKVSPGTYYYVAVIPGFDKPATGVITLIEN